MGQNGLIKAYLEVDDDDDGERRRRNVYVHICIQKEGAKKTGSSYIFFCDFVCKVVFTVVFQYLTIPL